MTRPQIVVNVAAAIARRGAPTDTGVAFMVYAGAAGSTNPVECYSQADALATAAPAPIAAYVGDALAQGAPKVVLLRAAAETPATVTETEWTTALNKLTADYGPGQVLIPGISSTAAHAALLGHAHTFGRCVLLDTKADATAAEIVTLAASLNAAEGAEMAALLAGWAVMPGPGGVTRQVPASVITAGLVGRNDARYGHANNAPAGDKGWGAGYITSAVGLAVNYTDEQHDDLHESGVSVFRVKNGTPQLYGWVSLSSDARYRQLNWGRMTMQLRHGIATGAETFLFRQIDGEGRLFSELEGMLRGYLGNLWRAGALFGADADEAFDVDVAGVNDQASIADGLLKAAVAVSLSTHTEKVTIDVVTNIAEGVSA